MFKFLKETENSEREKPVEKATFSIARAVNKSTANRKEIQRFDWIRPSGICKIDPTDFIIGYFLGHEREVADFKSQTRMDLGNLLHDNLQRILYKAGFLEGSGDEYIEEIVHCPIYGIVGHLDGVLKTEKLFPKKIIAEKRMHLEIKTTHDDNYRKTNTVDDIWEEYKWQAELYQHCKGLKETLFLFVNSESFSYKGLIYKHDPAIRQQVFEKIALIWDYIGRKKLPKYEKYTEEEWDKLVENVQIPLKPAEIDYKMAKATKKDVEDLFLSKWTGPEMVREHKFHPDRKWRFDFALIDQKVAVEIDGFGRHQTMSGFSKDCEKLNAAIKLGWRVLRYPASQVKNCPTCVVDDVLELL